MPLPPKILSVWGSPDGDDFLGSASLLDREHVLTVKHLFVDCYGIGTPSTPRSQAYVADAESGAGAIRRLAIVLQLHDECDVAILKLDRSWQEQGMHWPSFMSRHADLRGMTVHGHVVDPDQKTKSCPEYRIIDHDTGYQEWVLQNQTAKGYSGGLLTCRNEVVGLLHFRVPGEPRARALCVSPLLDWIELAIPGWARLAVKTDRFQQGLEEIERLLKDTPGFGLLSRDWDRRHVAPPTISFALIDLKQAVGSACLTWRTEHQGNVRALSTLRESCCRLAALVLALGLDHQALRDWAADPDRVVPFHSAGLAAVCVALTSGEKFQVSPKLPNGRDIHTTRTAVVSNALVAGVSDDARRDVGTQFYFDIYGQAIADLDEIAKEDLIEAMYLLAYADGMPFRVSGVAATKTRDAAYTSLVNLADEFRAIPVARSGVRDANCPILFEPEARLVQALRHCLVEIAQIT